MTPASTTKLQDIFRAVFELPDQADVTVLQQAGSEKWDSLIHVSLVAAIESEFGVTLDAADQLYMTSYEATRLLLGEKGT
jgi:acyl carrier protein